MTTDPLGSFRDQLVEGVGSEARRRRRRIAVTAGAAAALVIAAGAVAMSAGGSGEQQVTADGPAPTTSPPFECPVTRPPEPGFEPPEGWAAQPTQGVWYGTADLWTALPSDGSSPVPRKSVWWSRHFPGGREEGKPEVSVTWRRLDDPSAPQLRAEPPGTNAYTPGTGWFMIASEMDAASIGCWEVTASYKGHELSYVYVVLPELWAWDEPETGGEQAIVAGRVRFDEAGNCFLLERDGERFPVVWPYGTTVSDDAQTITLDDDTVIHLGDRVEGGGGYHGADVHALVDIERSACLVGDPEVAVFQASGPIEVTS